MQLGIILESMYQLEYFCDYAKNLADKLEDDEEKSKKYLEIAKSYLEMHNIFYNIYEEKYEKIPNYIKSHKEEISKDVVYDTIREYTGY